MKIEEARQILSSMKAGDQDDPRVREAMAMAEADPQLKQWLEEQQALDYTMAKALDDVAVPEFLEQALLETVRRPARRAPRRSRLIAWSMGLAALVVIGSSIGLLTTHISLFQGVRTMASGESPEDFENFREGMAFFIARTLYRLDHKSSNISEIVDWLDEREAPGFEELPESLLALNPIGCKKFDWRGQSVSLVCFHSVEGKIVHLFILDRSGLSEQAYENITTVATAQGLETGGWISSGRVYLLVGSEPGVDIEFALG